MSDVSTFTVTRYAAYDVVRPSGGFLNTILWEVLIRASGVPSMYARTRTL